MPTVPPIGSASAEPQRNKLRRIARLHPHEDRALAVLLRLVQAAAHVGGVGDPLAADLQDNVTSLEAVLRRNAIGIYLCNHHAFRATARDLPGGSKGEPEPGDVAAVGCRGIRCRRTCLTLIGQFAKGDR